MNKKGRRIIAFRKKGKTYTEIAYALKIPKSTVAWWLRNVKIPKFLEKQILEKSRKKWRRNIDEYNRIYGKIRSQEAAKIREDIKSKASKEIKNLSKKDLQLIGCALFWAEGNKKHRWHLRFANSDPEIIKPIMRFFREFCGIPNINIKARVHIYPSIDYKKTLNFWSKITKLNKNNFYKPQTQISRASKCKRPQNTLPYGTIHLVAGHTEITSRVGGWIQGISNKI